MDKRGLVTGEYSYRSWPWQRDNAYRLLKDGTGCGCGGDRPIRENTGCAGWRRCWPWWRNGLGGLWRLRRMSKLLPDGVVLLAFLTVGVESNNVNDGLRMCCLVLL